MTPAPSRRTRRSAAADAPESQSVTAEPWGESQAGAWLPAPGAADDKYRRGVLGARTGSALFPGAAVLSVAAAWRTGIGMVRYVPALDDGAAEHGLPSPAAAVLAVHPETVFGPPSDLTNCDAWIIGSGTDPDQRSASEHDALLSILAGASPVVVDAGALDLVHEERPVAPAILTPHAGEFTRLWQAAGLGTKPDGWPARTRSKRARPVKTEARVAATLQLAERLGTTVLLKGSTSVTATPGGQAFLTGPATPWLATAGTGDVLAGVLGALAAAQSDAIREDPELLGAIGASAAVVHDIAARLAAGAIGETTGGSSGHASAGSPITATDVIAAAPEAVARVRATRPTTSRRRHQQSAG